MKLRPQLMAFLGLAALSLAAVWIVAAAVSAQQADRADTSKASTEKASVDKASPDDLPLTDIVPPGAAAPGFDVAVDRRGFVEIAAGADEDAADAAEKPADPHRLALKTERVIVFKDGYCLIVKTGEATTNAAGEVYTDEVPDAAVLGSFWATPAEGRLLQMVAGWQTNTTKVEKETPCTQVVEVLLANKGRTASVELTDKGTYTGTIEQVLIENTSTPVTPETLKLFEMTEAAELMARAAAGIPITETIPSGNARTVSGISGYQFVLRTEAGDVLMPVGQVKNVTIRDMKTSLVRTVTTIERTKRLRFRFADADQKRTLSIIYFRPGVRWIPTYRIGLEPDGDMKQSQVALQCEILNEAEDFENVPVDIVVGVPNFRFRTTPSPLVLESVMRDALAAAAPQLMGQMRNDFSNSSYSQRSGEFRRGAAQGEPGADAAALDLPDDLTTTGAQDLFVYSLPRLNLKRGERTAVPIFTTKVPYRDVYTWDLHLKRSDIEAAPSGSGVQSPLVLSKNEVWHQIEPTNNTQVPWTTGAAMIMQGGQPLAQELLTYTSPRDAARVPVTVSVETRGSYEEKEVGRDLRALTWDNYNYARIDKEATLDLCNNKSIEIEVEITFRVGGKVTEVSHDGSITLGPFVPGDWENYRGHPAVNNSSTVKWKVKLGPGETFKPTVKYEYFTRS